MRAACIVSARTSREPSNRVIRGGNFNNNVGFRCAKTVVFLDARTPRIAPRFTDRASAAIHSPPCPSV
jgi:hypothetical protein